MGLYKCGTYDEQCSRALPQVEGHNVIRREDELKELRTTQPRPSLRRLASWLVLLIAAALFALAQDAGISAGGKWLKFETEEKMTGAKRVRFQLDADNFLQGSSVRPQVMIFCVGGKFSLGDFHPNLKMGGPNRISYWAGRPQMRVTVRVDNSHSKHSWNWVEGHFLAMDKDTTRQLIGANIFKVEFVTEDGPQIAEFSPAGLNLGWVKQACDMKPEKP
jgi:hypothetical protein